MGPLLWRAYGSGTAPPGTALAGSEPEPPRGHGLRIAAIALPLLGLVLSALWAWADVTSQLRASVKRDMLLLRAQVSRTIEVQDSMLAALNLNTESLSWSQIRASQAVHRLLVQLSDAAEAVDVLGFVDPQGHLAAASDAQWPAPPIDLSDRDYFAAFAHGTPPDHAFLGAAVLSRVDGRPQVHLARARVSVPPGEPGGVVVAGFRPKLFESLFQDVARGQGSTILLLRLQGDVLARFPEPLAPGSLHPLAAHEALRRQALTAPAGGALELSRSGMTAVQRIEPYRLVLAMSIDPSVARAAWLRQMVFPAAGAAAIAVLLLLLAHRTEARLAAEAARMRLRTEQVEAESAAAQDRARLEARLRKTERQAALGQLAAGVAHDFGNLLQTVMVGAEALRLPSPSPERIRASGDLIFRAAERGMALTRRMLDFARSEEQEHFSPAVERFDPGLALEQARDLIVPLLGRKWPVVLHPPAARLPTATGSLSECETVLINLAINARDAMPGGGTIVLEATLAEPPAALAGSASGAFVRISVTDTGCGMDPSTLARAGEAFFTTKPRGAGTGLGLSMARGFAQRAGGMLEITSAPGQGTTVTLWLATG